MPKLLDGREVANDCEEWRALCEARHVALLPAVEDRERYLDDCAAKRGQAAANELRTLYLHVVKVAQQQAEEVASLPNSQARHTRIAQHRQEFGDYAADLLERYARAIFKERARSA